MTGVTEHEIETPCGWCGNAITQPPTGRRKRYCDRSCRQRAYELRTAERRHQADVDAGRIRTVPAQRVVERTIQPRRPTTVAQWETALGDLAEQLHAGRYAWDRHRIRAAVNQVLGALGHRLPDAWVINGGDPSARPALSPAGPPGPPTIALAAVDGDLSDAQAAVIGCAGPDGIDTTLTRLQALTGRTEALLRAALRDLTATRLVVLRRLGEPVDDVDALSEHARFQLHLGDGQRRG
ncbi:hypothetical protein ACIBSS_32060 [Micromonospora aurantiaca]|uniref:hypothetical protein n=1 Tax=Micromonospora aurantiaca (nom. illeg.) TaxID=47850 RepID=UPI0008279941|nr:hypothetical protein [Micromonospora aurantiaca]SCL43708.1 hypothetical protein GA0070615_6749 [Micromonospora aurantiaca]